MNELSHCRNSTIQAGSERNSKHLFGKSLHSIIVMSDRKLGSDDRLRKDWATYKLDMELP